MEHVAGKGELSCHCGKLSASPRERFSRAAAAALTAHANTTNRVKLQLDLKVAICISGQYQVSASILLDMSTIHSYIN